MRETKLWTWHILAGILILIFLTLHMLIMHMEAIFHLFNPNPGEPIAWANVVARAKMGFFTVTYIILLGAALYHGLYGLRNILTELNLSEGGRKAISALLILLGLALFVVGLYATIIAHGMALKA